MIYNLGALASRSNVFTMAIPESMIGEEPTPDAWEAYLRETYPSPGPNDIGVIEGHVHEFDHATQVLRGRVAVYQKAPGLAIWRLKILSAPPADWRQPSYEWPCSFFVPKDHRHWIVSLQEFSETACLYAWRNETGDVVPMRDPFVSDTWVTG